VPVLQFVLVIMDFQFDLYPRFTLTFILSGHVHIYSVLLPFINLVDIL